MEDKCRELKEATGKLSFFPFHSELPFFDADRLKQTKCCGLGFVLVDSNKFVILAGAINILEESNT